MSGYHHCEHCKTWHDCNKPAEPSGGSGRAGALLALLLIILLSPLLMVTIEVWLEASCEKWPGWAKGCEVKRAILTNRDLDERVRKLEQRSQPSPTP